MAVYKDKWNGYAGDKSRVACYYKDWTGERKKLEKRGFRTKKEDLAYEREFLAKKTKDISMSFDTFIDIYMADMKPQLKLNTYMTKKHIIDSHIRPYFKDKSLCDISSTDILQWQNELLSLRDDSGKGYTQTYLRTIQNQLNAIFNHAVRYYELPKSPCIQNKKMGKSKTKEMLFWTRDEFLRFIETMKEKPMSYYAFELLFWTGIREGELLALSREDFDLEKRILRIRKSYQRIEKKDYITEPKTEKSNRDISLPEFLCDELEDYFGMLYKYDAKARLFAVSKHYLQHEMQRGCKESGVKKIRIHDLRHSHVAYLIELGFSPVEIASRLGHESITVTFTYSHLYPSKQKDLADKLNADRISAVESSIKGERENNE